MWVEDYKWHYDYVRLAWDTGFSFDKCKSPNLDKNKIGVVDIDQIVRERDVASVDRYISTVVQYILDDEQAKVLDNNFVKIFRLSQLAVEFLLFCKKYLDNTVVLLKEELSKNREENKDLKTFIHDLQSHIDALTRQPVLATFKCSICSKAFSSQEYLNAHVKRRHNNNYGSESYNVETDKLNSEIKQLKERLNNTEKLLKLKEEQSSEKLVNDSGNNGSKVDELLEKFEKFKLKVDVDLKELKLQKLFYEENYGKLFDFMINSKENIDPKQDAIKEISKAETTTQTDKLLHIENVHNRNVFEIQEPIPSSSKAKIEVLQDENNFKETKENLEAKISTTLVGIEHQMQTFWHKLNEIEKAKTAIVPQSDMKELYQPKEDNKNVKPKNKPRSILSQPTHTSVRGGDKAEKLKLAIKKLEQEEIFEHKRTSDEHNASQAEKSTDLVSEQHIPKSTNILPERIDTEEPSNDSKDEESLLESQSSESESLLAAQNEEVLVKPLVFVPGKRSTKRVSKEILKNLNKEIQEVVFSRIQELGISKSWSGIPQRSFEKSLEILNHQAALTRKTYSNFDLLKTKINGVVEKQCTRKKVGKTKFKTTPERQQRGKVQNIVNISYRPKPEKPTVARRNSNLNFKRETIEIKNRALYDTDTESERNAKGSYSKVIASTSQPHKMYSNVVNEFLSLPAVRLQKDQDSDLNYLNTTKEDLQKGVLKSFPSAGSLAKKKVLFDLDNDFSKSGDEPVIQKTGGSTTSIASSILEQSIKYTDDFAKYREDNGTKNKETDGNLINEKEINDLSDFDLSDL